MSGRLARLSVNQRLAATALVLGALAVFADPTHGGSVRVDAKELALMVSKHADEIAPAELADWIVAGRSDYRLVDLRAPAAYTAYHIPGAENVPIASLTDAGLLANERIVLYGGDGVETAQGWFLLRARGFRGAYILRGGLDGWTSDVQTLGLAAHFGVAPQAGCGEPDAKAPAARVASPIAAPLVAPTPTQTAKATAGPAAKKKEGC